jgi:hypothetical protein
VNEVVAAAWGMGSARAAPATLKIIRALIYILAGNRIGKWTCTRVRNWIFSKQRVDTKLPKKTKRTSQNFIEPQRRLGHRVECLTGGFSWWR